jgi:hypothetical protein
LFDQNPNVLTGCDESILDSLPPEPSPSGPFKSMIFGCVGKTAFHQMASLLAPDKSKTAKRMLPGYFRCIPSGFSKWTAQDERVVERRLGRWFCCARYQ